MSDSVTTDLTEATKAGNYLRECLRTGQDPAQALDSTRYVFWPELADTTPAVDPDEPTLFRPATVMGIPIDELLDATRQLTTAIYSAKDGRGGAHAEFVAALAQIRKLTAL